MVNISTKKIIKSIPLPSTAKTKAKIPIPIAGTLPRIFSLVADFLLKSANL